MDASHFVGRSVNAANLVEPCRPQSTAELAADKFIHVIGVSASIPAALALVTLSLQSGDLLKLTAILLYAAGLLAMLSCSAIYNLVREHWCRPVLRRCDHAAIFAMIAGSYTPFTLLSWDDGWSIGLTAIIWGLALIGMALKFWMPSRGLRTLTVAPYLLLGWIGLSAIFPLLTTLGPQTFSLIVLGGLFYSVGVLFHVWDSLPFQNAIWHGFVLAGAATHYVAILHGVVLSPAV
ncbi:MAG TPA: hemolysin III family protein [Dongiaceae bacterium]|nr:hemolysin III family protein [Dongiaceae bacterium]